MVEVRDLDEGVPVWNFLLCLIDGVYKIILLQCDVNNKEKSAYLYSYDILLGYWSLMVQERPETMEPSFLQTGCMVGLTGNRGIASSGEDM